MKNIKEIKKGYIVTYTTGKVNYVNKPEKYIKYFDDNFCNYNLYLTIKKIQRYVKFLGIYKLKTIYKK